jgi:hypothetical protein
LDDLLRRMFYNWETVPLSSLIGRLRSFVTRQSIPLLALLLFLPLVFAGYGSDVDTFRVLDAGRNFLATADYVPSRRPGYLVYEMAVFALDKTGGSVLVNLGTLFWALVVIVSFQRICRRHALPNANLLALILVLHPVFWYNATVSMDYIWALGMLLAGFDFLEQGRPGWAGLALGLAVGCRLSSLLVAVLLLAYAWVRSPGKRWPVVMGASLTFLMGILAYILPWDFSEWRWSFWKVSAGSSTLWSPLMQVGRFVYKNIYFWGLLAVVFGVVMVFLAMRNIRRWSRPETLPLAVLCILVFSSIQILFLRFPIQVEYLLPLLPFLLILAGLAVSSKKVLVIFLILVFSYNFFSINLAQPDAPSQASTVTFGVWVEPGYLLREMEARLALADCNSHACYDEHVPQRPGADQPGQ